MKPYLFILVFCCMGQQALWAQHDSIYFWKNGQLVAQRSIKAADLDSLTFHRPAVTLPSVHICNQTWMAFNLDVTTYRDGTPIPQASDFTTWSQMQIGAWCYANNDSGNGPVYGKLYNQYAIAGIYDAASMANPSLRKTLAPVGWHIPTAAEWQTLIDCLGGAAVAGGALKEAGLAHWYDPNTGATNSSGFRALPGGLRYDDGSFVAFRNSGHWGTQLFNNFPYGCVMDFDKATATLNYYNYTYGLSVRCVKD